MARRFEYSFTPLLTRLGFVRPDENPLPSADEVRLSLDVGTYPYSSPSVGCRHMWCSMNTPAVVGQFGTHIYAPPPGGAWLLALIANDGGWGTENQIGGIAGITVSGSNQQPFRPDNFEPQLNIGFVSRGTTVARSVDNLVSTYGFSGPVWWDGTRLIAQSQTVNQAYDTCIFYEPPLAGNVRG